MRSLLLAAAAAACVAHAFESGRMYAVGARRQITLAEELNEPALAWGSVTNSINSTGWGKLEIHGNASYSGDEESAVMWAAGYLEGSLTANVDGNNLIYAHVHNTGADLPLDPTVQAWLDENRLYVQGQVAANRGDARWRHTGLVYEQLEGLWAGYADHAPLPEQQLPFQAIYNVNLFGDFFDLDWLAYGAAAGNASAGTASGAARASHTRTRGGRTSIDSHCSALFIMTPDKRDIYAAHTTWADVTTMLRLYKQYDLPLSVGGDPAGGRVPGAQHIQSSYPASLYSSDDHYVMQPSGLVSIETTIINNNGSLYAEYMKPQSILEFVRNIVANRLADDAPSWHAIFSYQNSGTYCNTWMVLDTKLFTPGQPLPADSFWVGEQMPGFYVQGDFTSYLNAPGGYWASYNVIHDPFLFAISNQTALVAQYGPFFTFNGTVRANLFRREIGAGRVQDMQGMQRVMRFNDYANDPLSTQGCGANPSHSAAEGLSSRADLNPAGGDYLIPDVGYGGVLGIDTKIATAASIQAGLLSVLAQSGPTWDQQPAFNWGNTTLTGRSHLLQPELWQFPFVNITWVPTPQ